MDTPMKHTVFLRCVDGGEDAAATFTHHFS